MIGLLSPTVLSASPVIVTPANQATLVIAEANLRFNGGNGANTAYEAGIEASFSRLGVSGASALYTNGGPYEWNISGSVDDQWKQIMMQKWVAMCNSQNLEAFFEINRTGYPAYNTSGVGNSGELTVSIASVLPAGQGPKRLLYPDVEVARNTNPPAQVNGGIGTKIWWQK